MRSTYSSARNCKSRAISARALPRSSIEEVQAFLREADKRAYDLLSEHRMELDRIVTALLERENLDKNDIDELLQPPDTRREAAVEPVPSPILKPQPSLG